MSSRLLAIREWLPRYDRGLLRGDLAAGLAVTALIVPKNLGYAEIAGVPVQNGLYAAAAGALIYAVFGTCRQISTGAELRAGRDHARDRRALPGDVGAAAGPDRAVPVAPW
jgi:MFS superfamily sulfate permease-like transporter